ncbi:MAG: hypothetical protein COB59_01645 [Rhodospirillaceae bacterium]|nr:MAG: hypothetical protein COB59_01645 [Rhodospirillaceae bacterium]
MLKLRTIMPLVAIVSVVVLATACEEQAVKVDNPIRAIKTFTVAEVAGGSIRQYSGKVIAGDTAGLSFSSSGRVASISVRSGDRVTKGQELAALDKEPFLLDVQAAKADLNKAQSSLREKQHDAQRKQALFPKGWVTEAAVEQSLAAKEAAASQVNYAKSQLGRANRALSETIITAPFSGVIGERLFEPYMDVNGGQKVFSIEGIGALEVAISVPERAIADLHLGLPANVTFNAVKDLNVSGHVTEIATTAGPGSVFAVKVGLETPVASLRTGMSANVTLVSQNTNEKSGYMVPLAAISAGNQTAPGYVFVFNAKTTQVQKVPVKPQGMGRDNFVAVSGVKAGDVIASAGVSFLSDGQKVKLMTPAPR